MTKEKGSFRSLSGFATDPGSDTLTARLRYTLTGTSRLAQDLPVVANNSDYYRKIKAN